jgi:diguanylate cyclase (GGDEF)-like protein/PAS domain S-box-containing protein
MGKTGQSTLGGPASAWRRTAPGDHAFRALVESVREYAIVLLDRNGAVTSWNIGAELIMGYSAAEASGRHLSAFYPATDVARGWPQHALDAAARSGRAEDEGWRVRKDGQRFWAHAVLTALRDADGDLYGFGQVVRDLTEARRRDEELRRSEDRSSRFWNEAIRDPLTGVFNRRYMVEHLRGTIDRAENRIASLVVFDVDRFKAINDRLGHATGDTVLTAVAAVARRQSRAGDMLFRLGGDEFVIYLPGVAARKAAAIAERLRAAVAAARVLDAGTVTVSVGVAQLRPSDSTESWLQRADAAMYEAKRQGRNRVV